MAQELINTSVPKGLTPGAQGYCTVAYTQGMPPNYVQLAETLCSYSPIFPASDSSRYPAANPTAYSHYCVRSGGQPLSILSRVACHTIDFSGRSNYLAHHVIVDLTQEAVSNAGPAAVMQHPGMFRHEWTDPPQLFPSECWMPDGAPALSAVAEEWGALAGGEAGWAGRVAARFMDDPRSVTWIIYDPETVATRNQGLTSERDHQPVLRLVAEAMALIPNDMRWQVTYTTYFQQPFLQSECNWRFLAKGSRGFREARFTPNDLRIDLTALPPFEDDGCALVASARMGTAPNWEKWRPATAAQAAIVQRHLNEKTSVSTGGSSDRVQIIDDSTPAVRPLPLPEPAPAFARADTMFTHQQGSASSPNRDPNFILKILGIGFVVLLLVAIIFGLVHMGRRQSAWLDEDPSAPTSTTETQPKPVPAAGGPPVEQAQQPAAESPASAEADTGGPAPAAVDDDATKSAPTEKPDETPKASTAPTPSPLKRGVLVVFPRANAGETRHSLKSLKDTLRAAGIDNPPQSFEGVQFTLFGGAGVARKLDLGKLESRVSKAAAGSGGLTTTTQSRSIKGGEVNGSLEVEPKCWSLVGDGAEAPVVFALLTPNDDSWCAVELCRTLETSLIAKECTTSAPPPIASLDLGALLACLPPEARSALLRGLVEDVKWEGKAVVECKLAWRVSEEEINVHGVAEAGADSTISFTVKTVKGRSGRKSYDKYRENYIENAWKRWEAKAEKEPICVETGKKLRAPQLTKIGEKYEAEEKTLEEELPALPDKPAFTKTARKRKSARRKLSAEAKKKKLDAMEKKWAKPVKGLDPVRNLRSYTNVKKWTAAHKLAENHVKAWKTAEWKKRDSACQEFRVYDVFKNAEGQHWGGTECDSTFAVILDEYALIHRGNPLIDSEEFRLYRTAVLQDIVVQRYMVLKNQYDAKKEERSAAKKTKKRLQKEWKKEIQVHFRKLREKGGQMTVAITEARCGTSEPERLLLEAMAP